MDCKYLPEFQKIRQIEIRKTFAHVSVEIKEPEIKKQDRFIGIDCNTTGYVAVVAIPYTGKTCKFGKMAIHTHAKYKQIRKRLQRKGVSQLHKERDLRKGITDAPQKAMQKIMVDCNLRTHDTLASGVCQKQLKE